MMIEMNEGLGHGLNTMGWLQFFFILLMAILYNLPVRMKEDEQRNNYQKQMLISRLYKSKNNPSNNKQLPKPEETNLLFYVPFNSLSKPRRSPSGKRKPKKYYPCLPAPRGPPLPRISHQSIPACCLPGGPVAAVPSPTRKSNRVKKACRCGAHRSGYPAESKCSHFPLIWCLLRSTVAKRWRSQTGTWLHSSRWCVRRS